MKSRGALLLGLLMTLQPGVAAPLTDEPLPELKLGNGKILKIAVARSYSATSVLVKHADGAASVRYEDFPETYRGPLIAKRDAIEDEAEGGANSVAGIPEKPVLFKVSYDFPAPPPLRSRAGDEQVLAGQIFVSTPDAGNVKLGGVKVSVYSKADYRKQAAWYFANPWEASRTHSKNAEMLAKAGDGAGAMAQFVEATETAAVGWLLVAPAEYSTTTDADGRFTLTHRVPPPYFVVAEASRIVDGETENYRWAVLSTLIDEPGNLVLFNDNMD
jgi:hypothetical protein